MNDKDQTTPENPDESTQDQSPAASTPPPAPVPTDGTDSDPKAVGE